ncbi:MAG: hypothetical protein K0R14_285 [Burkholderiales bacterium]|jgi:hypothetical protein|nr:hypothetical protein [Burkholderiales bacterium]
MKRFKIACALFGILCCFICDSKTLNNSSNSKKIPDILGSFTLWGKQNDINTAFAGEIIGNNITVQIPADTDLSVPLFLTYTGLKKGYMELRTQENKLIPSNSSMIISENNTFTALKNDQSQIYNVSVIRRPYFKFYDIAKTCVKDTDGNIWVKTPNIPGGNWSSTFAYVKSSFSTCGIPVGKWSLPCSQQGQAMINRVPLDFQFPSQVGPNTGPLAWFNGQKESGIQLFNLPNDFDFWSREEDINNPDNALAIRLSSPPKIVSNPKEYFAVAWAISSGDGTSAKTITDFVFTPENGVSSKGIIAGNQIFVTTSLWANLGQIIKSNVIFSVTGGTVSYNGKPLTKDVSTGYNLSQPIPITVTANNGEKNIYTLIVKTTIPLPPKKPDTPALVTICSSSNISDPDKKFNRIITAIVGSNFYQYYLPLPGSCSQLNLGSTSIKDLEAYNVLWFSFFNEIPIGSTSFVDNTGYYHDIIPKFTWAPNSNGLDPSGFDLSVTVDPACHHDSQSPSGVTPSCTN